MPDYQPLLDLLHAMQQDAEEFLTGEIEEGEFISRMLYKLDGPEQRDAEEMLR